MLSKNKKAILRVLSHPEVLPYVIDDESCLERDIDPFLNGLYYLMPNEDSLFLFAKRNVITYEVHVALLPNVRKQGRELGKQCFAWMFDNTKCKKIVASIPSYNRLCLMFARSNGMKNEGISTKSFQLNGELYDMYNFGLTEGEFRCLQ